MPLTRDEPTVHDLGNANNTHATYWHNTLCLVLSVTLARIGYMIWLSSYELVFDEAQYWEWSRRLDLSYYTKGPGVAWTIAVATRWLGDSEWAIRMPSILASMIGAFAVARLATLMSRGNQRAGFFAAACFLLIPMYQIMSMVMTIDGPLLACWALALWAGWRTFDSLERGRSKLVFWLALALALGVGFLYKYTMALLIPGLLVHAIIRARYLRGGRRGIAHLLIALVVMAFVMSPVFIWNHKRGWPTTRHLMGHIGIAGGDVAPSDQAAAWYAPALWFLDFLGAQILIVGPMVILFVLAAKRAFKERWQYGDLWPGRLLMLNSAWPIMLFYAIAALMHRSEGNWAIAAHVGLTVLAGQYLANELERHTRLVDTWRALPHPRPRQGWILRRPETPSQLAWHFTLGYGLVFAVILLTLNQLATVPGVGKLVPTGRFTGWRNAAIAVEQQAREAQEKAGRQPWIVTGYYGSASQLAYYMPVQENGDHWTVYSAESYLGGRPSSHDFFADTDFRSPELHGRPALLFGQTAEQWKQHFRFKRITEIAAIPLHRPEDSPVKIFLGTGYQGPITRPLGDLSDRTATMP